MEKIVATAFSLCFCIILIMVVYFICEYAFRNHGFNRIKEHKFKAILKNPDKEAELTIFNKRNVLMASNVKCDVMDDPVEDKIHVKITGYFNRTDLIDEF